MRSVSDTGSRPRGPRPGRAALLPGSPAIGPRQAAARRTALWRGLAVLLTPALILMLAACSGTSCRSSGGGAGSREEKTVLLTKKGESSIRVSESEVDGNQIVRIHTVFRGEENTIVLDIDQAVYEVEIPLTLDQVIPQSASAQVRGPEGQFQDLLVAQWLQKAQEAMLAGDYNGALRQVDTVLQIQPSHTQAHSMKGSVYYALGNYELASEEWQYVLSLDPTNKEVQDFQAFLKNRSSGRPPQLPGAPAGTSTPVPPAAPTAAGGGAAGGAGNGAGKAAPKPPVPGGTR